MTDKTNNMEFWDKISRPPTSALKKIEGGRLKGMSNISPQWRWQIMTQTFGMVGFGWKYTIEKRWTSPGANEEHFCFVEILLYVKVNDVWSEAIPGSGGSMLVEKERNGMHNNDEAFKMAETDALGTAMAKLGVAADVYLGSFDGSKYREFKDVQTFPKQVNSPKDVQPAVQSVQAAKATTQGETTWTPEQIRNNKNHQMEHLRKSTNATGVEIVSFLKTLDANKKYSLIDIENGLADIKAKAALENTETTTNETGE